MAASIVKMLAYNPRINFCDHLKETRMLEQLYSYIIHLLSAFVMIGVYTAVYLKITPFDEIALIRKGGVAAALSFGGTTLGFSLTVGSSILHSDSYTIFLMWTGAAAVVQILTYLFISKMLPSLNDDLNNNNVAMGAFMGSLSLIVGIINAACLS